MKPTYEQLIDYDLLNPRGRQWKYRYSVGSSWLSASTQEKATECATEAFMKAKPGELLTKEQRFENSDREEITRSHGMWGNLSMHELLSLFERMGGDNASLRTSSSREFNGNGGRRTSYAVSAAGARETAEMLMKLNRYIVWREENTA